MSRLLLPPSVHELPEHERQLVANLKAKMAQDAFYKRGGWSPDVHPEHIGYVFNKERTKVSPVYRTDNGTFELEKHGDGNSTFAIGTQTIYLEE